MSTTEELTTDDSGTPAWEPRGHPVRWAIGIVALLVAVLSVSIWFGALSPQLDVRAAGWVVGSETATVTLEVRNEGHADVDLVSVGASLPGLELTGTELSPGRPLGGDGVVLDPGETVTVTLGYRITDCEGVPQDPSGFPLVARTPLGLTRTVHGPDELSGMTLNDETLSWTQELLDRCMAVVVP